MKKIISIILLSVVALTLFAGCQKEEVKPAPAPAPAPEPQKVTLALGGSTSVEKVVQSMMEAYMAEHKHVTLTYAPTGSGTGIQGANEGTLDIGLSSRGLKDAEKANLQEIVFALDGIAVAVNKENKVKDLSLETLAKIYTGEVKNWKEVGGDDVKIVVVGRDAASGTRDGFESIVGVKEKCAYAEEQASTGAVLGSVQNNKGAIGYISLASANDTINVLTIDGVAASEAAVQDGSYKLQRPFVFAVKKDLTNEAVKAFVDWAVSPATSDMVRKAGAVPVA